MEKLTEEQRKKRQQEIEEKKEYLRGYEKAVRQMKRSEEKMIEMHLNKIMPSTESNNHRIVMSYYLSTNA